MQAISLHSLVPVRTEPQESAEMSTQMLFGEVCTILREQPRWSYIRLLQDGQEGWVDAKMIASLSEQEERQITTAPYALVVFPMAYAVSENNGQTIPLTAGTRLYNYKDGRFEMLGVGFRIDPSMVIEQALLLNEQNLLQTVRFFLNIPYLWGGKNAMGMDCSGFTQTVLSLFGRSLLRNASQQAAQGQLIENLESVQAGDLAFFCKPDSESKSVTHVGILIDSSRIIHCSGRVKVEKIDPQGIFSVEQADAAHPQGQYTHTLLNIRRC